MLREQNENTVCGGVRAPAHSLAYALTAVDGGVEGEEEFPFARHAAVRSRVLIMAGFAFFCVVIFRAFSRMVETTKMTFKELHFWDCHRINRREAFRMYTQYDI